jgi:hypothetical protein
LLNIKNKKARREDGLGIMVQQVLLHYFRSCKVHHQLLLIAKFFMFDLPNVKIDFEFANLFLK